MGIKDLPRPGINFRATAGAGNFQRKLSGATRYGDLKNLRDNQKAVVDVVKKHQGVIRIKGLSRLQQLSAWHEIQAKDKTITKEDKREIKEVLKHLGRGAATGGGKKAVKPGVIKASDGKSYLTEEQVKRNLARNVERDGLGIRNKMKYGELSVTHFAGGDVQTLSPGSVTNEPLSGGPRTKGSMGDLNIKRGVTGSGFALRPDLN